MGVMSILDRTGDSRLQWDQDKHDEVKAAEAKFHEWVKKGMTAFKTDKDGNKEEQVQHFDPTAERYIFTPQLQGG